MRREDGEGKKNLVIGLQNNGRYVQGKSNSPYVFFWTIKKLYVGKRDHPSSLFYLPINILTVTLNVVR